jgi:hypothetical protein
MQSLQAHVASHGYTIHTLAHYVQAYLDAHTQPVFAIYKAELKRQYEELGEAVYGVYGKHLFAPLYVQFKAIGLRTTPRLPFGGFADSREWGPEDDRQRWFWSKMSSDEGVVFGTLALAFYHDHMQLRIPRPLRVVPIEAATKGAVIAALAGILPEFGQTRDARSEIAAYLAQQAQESAAAVHAATGFESPHTP